MEISAEVFAEEVADGGEVLEGFAGGGVPAVVGEVGLEIFFDAEDAEEGVIGELEFEVADVSDGGGRGGGV